MKLKILEEIIQNKNKKIEYVRNEKFKKLKDI